MPDTSASPKGDLFEIVCPDCESVEFKVVGINTKSGKFEVVKLACANCPTDLPVKSGTVA